MNGGRKTGGATNCASFDLFMHSEYPTAVFYQDGLRSLTEACQETRTFKTYRLLAGDATLAR